MKTKNLLLTLLVAIFLWSCSDDSDMTVILKEAGKLKVEFTQNGAPLIGTMVYLIPEMNGGEDKGNSYIEYAIDFKETDEDGIVDFGEVNVGNYYVITEGVVVGSMTYNPVRIVQVVSDTKKEYTVEVLDYKGTITLTVFTYDEYYELVPTSGIKVAILPQEDVIYPYEDAIDFAFAEKTTNSDGIVTFELPSGYYYDAIIYTTDSYGVIEDIDNYSITYLETGYEYSINIHFYYY